MTMKRAVGEFRIEGTEEIEVPKGATEEQIERLFLEEVKKHAGEYVADIIFVRVTHIEHDNGGF